MREREREREREGGEEHARERGKLEENSTPFFFFLHNLFLSKKNTFSKKNFSWDPLPAAAERAILKFVHSLACCRVRDDAELFEGEEEEEEERKRRGEGSSQEKKKKLDVASLFTSSSSSSSDLLDPQAALLVRVLHLRAAFGGMPCDVAMMRSAADAWLRRFAGRGGVPPPPPMTTAAATAAAATMANNTAPLSACALWLSFLWRSFSPPLVPPLRCLHQEPARSSAVGRMTQEDVPLSAVDFHVSSISEELLALPAVAREAGKAARAVGESEHDQEAAEERLRRAMWLFRSSRNVRSPGSGAEAGAGSPPLRLASDLDLRPPPPLRSLSPRRSRRPQRRLRPRQGAPGAVRLRARRPEPLWRAAAAAADSWSAEFLRQRFRARGRF